MSASADALSAAGVTEAFPDSPSGASRRGPSGCTVEASDRAQSSGLEGTPAMDAALLGVPGRETAATASSAAQSDSMALSLSANAQGTDSVSADVAVPDSVMAERTAVRALMARASILKHLGRLQEALHVLEMAEMFDRGVEVHRRQLQAVLLGRPEPGRGSKRDL